MCAVRDCPPCRRPDRRTPGAPTPAQAPDMGAHSLIVVPLAARGLVLGVMTLWRSRRPDAFETDDLTLAQETRLARRRRHRQRPALHTAAADRVHPAEQPAAPGGSGPAGRRGGPAVPAGQRGPGSGRRLVRRHSPVRGPGRPRRRRRGGTRHSCRRHHGPAAHRRPYARQSRPGTGRGPLPPRRPGQPAGGRTGSGRRAARGRAGRRRHVPVRRVRPGLRTPLRRPRRSSAAGGDRSGWTGGPARPARRPTARPGRPAVRGPGHRTGRGKPAEPVHQRNHRRAPHRRRRRPDEAVRSARPPCGRPGAHLPSGSTRWCPRAPAATSSC